jgi:hypothetical protein
VSRADQEELEGIILCHMRIRGSGWVTSREIAVEIGFPWRKVARAMLRMPDLEKTRIIWIAARYRPRVCNSFRYVSAPTATYPTWLVPKAHPVPEGIGYVNIMER